MNEDLTPRVLTARKGYEFSLDNLRLTMLCTQPIIHQIQEAFHFQGMAIMSPPATFGPVANTLPAGLVFQVGYWLSTDHKLVPIRFLNIEPVRIVIDVAGPSQAVDEIYSHLRNLLADVTAPDGTAVLGEPLRVLDYSELSVRLPTALDAVFIPEVRELLARTAREAEKEEATILFPTLLFRAVPPNSAFGGDVNTGDGHTFSVGLRASTKPSEAVYFSSAPLETEAHLTFLTQLTTCLTASA